MGAGRQRGGGKGNVRALALMHLCCGGRMALVEEGIGSGAGATAIDALLGL